MSSTKRRVTTIALLLGAAGGAGLMSTCARMPEDLGVAEGRLRPCPSSPNCVCSEDQGAAAGIPPLRFEGDAQAAFEALLALVADESGAELITIEAQYAHAVFRTPLLRFRDDVEFRLDPAARVIHVRSASRVGYSDLGSNRKRIEALRERWQARQDA